MYKRQMLNTALESPNIPEAIENMKKEAVLIRDNDIASCRKIGENGLKLLRDVYKRQNIHSSR